MNKTKHNNINVQNPTANSVPSFIVYCQSSKNSSDNIYGINLTTQHMLTDPSSTENLNIPTKIAFN